MWSGPDKVVQTGENWYFQNSQKTSPIWFRPLFLVQTTKTWSIPSFSRLLSKTYMTPKERRQKRELPRTQERAPACSQSVSQLFHGPAPRSPLHRLWGESVQRAASRAFLPRVSLDISSALHYAHASGVCAYKSRALPCSPVCAPHSPTARSCGLRASAMQGYAPRPRRRGRVIGATSWVHSRISRLARAHFLSADMLGARSASWSAWP